MSARVRPSTPRVASWPSNSSALGGRPADGSGPRASLSVSTLTGLVCDPDTLGFVSAWPAAVSGETNLATSNMSGASDIVLQNIAPFDVTVLEVHPDPATFLGQGPEVGPHMRCVPRFHRRAPLEPPCGVGKDVRDAQ